MFQDYSGLLTQYGYTILFVSAFPIGPVLAFVSSFIQIRVDGWKLCQAVRRPEPRTNEDIGVWEDMLEIVSVLAIILNMAVLTFTSSYLENYPWKVCTRFSQIENMISDVVFVRSDGLYLLLVNMLYSSRNT